MTEANRHRGEFTLLGRAATGVAVRTVTVEPGHTHVYDAADWAGALVVVERGRIEVVTSTGATHRFDGGSVLVLAGLSPLALRNPGTEPAVLSAATRHR